LAARLQALAEPNTVTVSDRTRRLAGDVFQYDSLGSRELKGLSDPVHIYRATTERAAASRFAALHRARLTPFVGREGEVDLLTRRWEEAKDGDGQVVLISGEPGIGKSRISETFHERVAAEPHAFLLFQCSPFHVNSALHPIITQLEASIGLDPEFDPEVNLGHLEAFLTPYEDGLGERGALMAGLLSLSMGRFPPLHMSPQKQMERTIEVLVEHISRQALVDPLLVVFEDMHWIDPTTLELVDRLVATAAESRMLLVATFRPEFTPHWGNHAHVSAHSLHRLGRRVSSELVEKVMGGRTGPDELVSQIVAKADGVPLFIEELTKGVLESDMLVDTGQHYELSRGVDTMTIPDTLHDSLMARLDRLMASVKEVAQIGAAIGREFSYRLVAGLSSMTVEDLEVALESLVASELVHRKGNPPEAAYTFKHALVQDAAYDSLLKRDRQKLHAGIAESLLESTPTIAEGEPELVAHHFGEAGLIEPAIEYWGRAGQNAAGRAANREAIEYFWKALRLLETLPEGGDRDAAELDLLTHLGPALMIVEGWAAGEVGTVYQRANALAERIKTSVDLVPPLVGIWLFHNARGHYDLADEVTGKLFDIARTTSNEDVLLQAHHAEWPILLFRGSFEAADDKIEKGLGLYEFERHKGHALLYMGHDPAVCAHGCGSQVVWTLGYPERAEQHATRALEIARQVAHAPTLAFGLWYVTGARAASGDTRAVLDAMDELLRLSREQKLGPFEAAAQLLSGWALAASGSAGEGLERMRAGFDIWNGTGNRTWLHVFTCLHGDSLLRAERYADALATLDRALEIGEQTGERRWESRIHHLRAEALLHAGDPESAEECLRHAIRVAQAQKARSWELGAATALAKLLAERGERVAGHCQLAPIYEWFTEGFETRGLVEARTLLEELG
jgi:predicted ATPase